MARDDPAQPMSYEVEINGVQLAIVDSNALLPEDTVFQGRVADEQIEWLGTITAKEDSHPLIVATDHSNPKL